MFQEKDDSSDCWAESVNVGIDIFYKKLPWRNGSHVFTGGHHGDHGHQDKDNYHGDYDG